MEIAGAAIEEKIGFVEGVKPLDLAEDKLVKILGRWVYPHDSICGKPCKNERDLICADCFIPHMVDINNHHQVGGVPLFLLGLSLKSAWIDGS